VESKVRPLGDRVTWLQAPQAPADVTKLVESICTSVGFGDSKWSKQESQAQQAVKLPILRVAANSVDAADLSRPVVIGITGCTRSGKSRLAQAIRDELRLPQSSVVAQDAFWSHAVLVQASSGAEVVSEEEPECTDNTLFAAALQEAIAAAVPLPGRGRGCVIAEGFQLLHDDRVAGLLDYVFFIDLSRQECITRRSAPRGPSNPNPMSMEQCELLVWPAHERYVRDSIAPLRERIRWLAPPGEPSSLAKVAEEICVEVGLLLPSARESFSSTAEQRLPKLRSSVAMATWCLCSPCATVS